MECALAGVPDDIGDILKFNGVPYQEGGSNHDILCVWLRSQLHPLVLKYRDEQAKGNVTAEIDGITVG